MTFPVCSLAKLQFTEKGEEPTVASLGGKGYNLVHLTRGGFRVPTGFVVKASAFTEFVNSCSLIQKVENYQGSIDQKCSLIQSLFQDTPFSPIVYDAVNTMLTKLQSDPAPLFAVRSSGVTEDLDEASFAGMNDTILNVPAEANAICDAIKLCWRSLFSKRSITYREENGFPMFNTAIAVVVQVMIPSECSGVIFTADAQTGSRGEMSLDGVQGLGEALVSGMVSTDHWTIRKAYGSRKMRVVDCRPAYQEYKLVSKYPEPGTEKVELGEEGKKCALTPEQVMEVASTSCLIEKYYSKPMDIEFCFYQGSLYIVQARPITHLLSVPDNLNPLENPPQWSVWMSISGIFMSFIYCR